MDNKRKFVVINPAGSEDERSIKGKKVHKKDLINKLNYINFQDGTILVNFRHAKYDHTVFFRAKPLPCLEDELKCIWAETDKIYKQETSYKFQDILIPDGQNVLILKSNEIDINDEGIRLLLPETCQEISPRKMERHTCKGVKVQLIQNSVSFYGILTDFSAASFRVEVTADPPQTFQWIDRESPVNLVFSDENEMLYSGECKILRQIEDRKTRSYVLEPLNYQIRRFKPKEFRSSRLRLLPSPNIIFRHPFTGKMNNMKVIDLSGSGFSVEEDRNNAVLLPGMIIPELELSFANVFNVKCQAQVVYRKIKNEEENNSWVKCGMAILDMDIEDHGKLLALLHQAKDGHSYICNRVNMDDLWNFFFESGFLYPKKYGFLEANKEKIKETYKRLYTRNPKIARHFIHQDKGRILGHVAMIRFYENAWLIHHHASRRPGLKRSGIAVLDQIGRFTNASHGLYSLHMDYLFCYFRPENKFPNRVFGGVAKEVNNPKASSLDTFAYFHFQKASNSELHFPEPWRLIKSETEDLLEFERCYKHMSGGLMLDALDIKPDMFDCDDLSQEYATLGFKREKYFFSLKKDANLKAVLMVIISDVGLNMSDLTNCIKVFVLNPDGLSKDILYLTLSFLSEKFEQNEIPVLIYPVSYAENQLIPYEKLYLMWVLNTQYSDHYFRCLKGLLKDIGS